MNRPPANSPPSVPGLSGIRGDALPIDHVLDELRRVLDGHCGAVLEAPPGAGKTTRVPLALLDASWLAGRTILMLEPRRLAARAAAARLAQQLGETVGQTVGYRIRHDTKVGPRTRIEVVTEGILTRRLQRDPELIGVGLVIFDEFHERSLHADLGLALCLDIQGSLRDDLRLLVMSATLDGAPIARLLGDVPVVRSAGRAWPVETRYLPREREPGTWTDTLAARVVRQALAEESGNILVFLPGVGEIQRVAAMLASPPPNPAEVGGPVDVAPLYGDLTRDAQDAAILPPPPGRRKVVLATAIAETSLTIEGIRVVVDAGETRTAIFDPAVGMARLTTRPASTASADQRRGRAGRLEAGVCYRLWTAADQTRRPAFGAPEIAIADLAPLALELAAWGIADPAALRWLDAPPAAPFAQAVALLGDLGALDGRGRLTTHGRAMLRLGVHPRLAHMLIRGRDLGLGALACDLAALLEERDLLRAERGFGDADLSLRLQALRGRGGAAPGMRVDHGVRQRVRQSADQMRQRLLGRRQADEDDDAGGLAGGDADADMDAEASDVAGSSGASGAAGVADVSATASVSASAAALDPADATSAGLLLAFAYPDRIAERRPGEAARFRLANGRGARFDDPQPLSRAPLLVAAHLDGDGREARIYLAAPLDRADLDTHFGDRVVTVDEVRWDSRERVVTARRQRRLGAVVLDDAPLREPDTEAVRAALLEGVRDVGLTALPWNKDLEHWRERLIWVRRASGDPVWPDLTDDGLLASLTDWLAPWLDGMSRLSHLQRLRLGDALHARLSWDLQQRLERDAPTHMTVPTGSRIRLDYTGETPVLAVRIQEVFGLAATPRLAGGRVPILLHLLSPGHRPVQVTQDLASFWATTYDYVKKELKGRYPKHYWPDNPLEAEPTRFTKARMREPPPQ